MGQFQVIIANRRVEIVNQSVSSEDILLDEIHQVTVQVSAIPICQDSALKTAISEKALPRLPSGAFTATLGKNHHLGNVSGDVRGKRPWICDISSSRRQI